MSDVFPIIRGRETMPSGQNQKFNHLDPLASGISNAQPDYYNGSRPTQIRPRVRDDLGPYIIPSTQQHRPALPNFFMEAKGPDGKASEVKRQITQDLAGGARGMLKMQSYGQDEPVYDGNAYVYGTTYNSGAGTLQLYAMHPTEPANPDGELEYHTTQVTAFALTANPDSCRQGLRGFRNLQDMAKEKRDAFIACANEAADAEEAPPLADPYLTSFTSPSQISSQNEHSFTSDTVHAESETSTDELAMPVNLPAKRSKLRQPRRPKRNTGIPCSQEDEEWA
jgi:hypothetical protein